MEKFDSKKFFTRESKPVQAEKFFERDCTDVLKSVCDHIPQNLHYKIRELLQTLIEEAMVVAYLKGYLRATQSYADKSAREVAWLKELNHQIRILKGAL